MTRNPREDTAILILFLAGLLASVAVATIGWSHAISDSYGWRQTQTALSAYFMLRGGPWLAYETPLLGPPWRIPHEIPIYQALVVSLVSATGLKLEAAGRVVSLALFYAALGSGYLLLAELGISARRRLLMLAFWLMSPLYLFWSRTFMIESTALFLCLTFLAFSGRYFARRGWPDALVAVLAGSLGAAVKPPTVAVFVALAGVWWLQTIVRARPRHWSAVPLLGPFVVVLPFGAGWLWQRYADSLKAFDFNPLTWGLASRQLFQDWIVGPTGQRFLPSTWAILWESPIPDAIGHPVVLAVAAACVLVAGRRRGLFALGLAGFLAHYVIFTPLDVSHTYYLYAAGLYLVAAIGFAGVALLETGDNRRHLAWLLAAVVVVFFARGYLTRMLPLQQQDAYRKPNWVVRMANAINEATAPDEVIVGFGLGWDPEVPYYAKRRAVMWPGWGDPRPDSPDVVRTLANLDRYTVGAFFNCFHGLPPETLALFLEHWRLQESPVHRGRCEVYVRPPSRPAFTR